jgi:hypothetical protein
MANFRILSNQPQIVSEYFLRSDTPDGLARGADGGILQPPQSAIDAFMQGLASGQIVPESPQGLQLAQSYGYAPAGPTDPNYLQNQLTAGVSGADLVFGQVPGTPANTQPTVQMRQLLQSALNADRDSRLAYQQADQANKIGDQQMALAQKAQGDQYALAARQMDQQAAQFAQQFGLQEIESQFRRELATEQQALEGQKFDLSAELGRGQLDLARQGQQLETDKYTSQLASAPQNLVQSALWQGSRTPGFRPDAGAFGGNANTATAQGAGSPGVAQYGQQQVPVGAGVQALLQRKYVPRTGMFDAAGSMTSLNSLQNDPNLRLQAGNMDAASLNNTFQDPELAPFLDSTLKAQGQTSASFQQALQAALPTKSATVQQSY